MPEALRRAEQAGANSDPRFAARFALLRAEHAFRRDQSVGFERAYEAIRVSEEAGETYLAARAHRLVGNMM
ncbi:hypothetical protein ABTD62_22520, partial [Acinetobacter baumannii]